MSTLRSLGVALFALSALSGCDCGGNKLKPAEQIPLPTIDAGPGCSANAEVCNNVDDDCDGEVDEDQPMVTCGLGACVRTMPSCANGGEVTCQPFAPTDEVCNGIDDDCDGEVDEGFGETTCGVGECVAMANTCVDGVGSACMPLPAKTETCNGKDDDCDGTVDEDLLTNTSGDVRITNNPAASDYVYMGKGQAGFGLVWQDKRDGADGQIYFAAVSSQGVRTGGDVRVSNTSGSSVHPAVVWNGSTWGLFYADDNKDNFELYFRPLSASGGPQGSALRLTNAAGSTDWPDVVWTGNNYAVAYDDQRAGSGKHDIYFQRIDRNGNAIGAEVQVTTDPKRQSAPILKWNGTEFGVAWTDYRDAQRSIYFRKLAADGQPLGSEVRVNASGNDASWPDLAWNDVDREWALVWHEAIGSNTEVMFTRLHVDGSRVGGDVQLTNAAGSSSYPSIDWNGFQYGVSFQDDRDVANKPAIYFASVSAVGMKNGSEVKISSGSGSSSFTTALWNGSTFAFGWRDDRNGATNTELYFALVGCAP